MLRPTMFLVLTLGLIGTWQVFDQVYVMSQGGPGKTTLTPAYLSYPTAFDNAQYGNGAAISFVLFAHHHSVAFSAGAARQRLPLGRDCVRGRETAA